MKKETILENCANEPVRVKRSTLKIENCAKPPVYNSPIHNAQKSHIAKKTSSNHRTCATRRNATRSCTCDYRPNDTARSNTCVNKDRVAVKPQRYGCVSGGVECNELRVAFECCKAAVRPRAGARHYTAVPKIHSLDSLCGDDVMIIWWWWWWWWLTASASSSRAVPFVGKCANESFDVANFGCELGLWFRSIGVNELCSYRSFEIGGCLSNGDWIIVCISACINNCNNIAFGSFDRCDVRPRVGHSIQLSKRTNLSRSSDVLGIIEVYERQIIHGERSIFQHQI